MLGDVIKPQFSHKFWRKTDNSTLQYSSICDQFQLLQLLLGILTYLIHIFQSDWKCSVYINEGNSATCGQFLIL